MMSVPIGYVVYKMPMSYHSWCTSDVFGFHYLYVSLHTHFANSYHFFVLFTMELYIGKGFGSKWKQRSINENQKIIVIYINTYKSFIKIVNSYLMHHSVSPILF